MLLPLMASHTCTVRSTLAEARRFPSGEQVLPGGGIPHLHRLIITRRGDTSAIGRPGDGSHTGGMTTTDAQGGSQGLSGSWVSNDCRSDLQGIRVKTSSRTSG